MKTLNKNDLRELAQTAKEMAELMLKSSGFDANNIDEDALLENMKKKLGNVVDIESDKAMSAESDSIKELSKVVENLANKPPQPIEVFVRSPDIQVESPTINVAAPESPTMNITVQTPPRETEIFDEDGKQVGKKVEKKQT